MQTSKELRIENGERGERGAPRSESVIYMLAGGKHTYTKPVAETYRGPHKASFVGRGKAKTQAVFPACGKYNIVACALTKRVAAVCVQRSRAVGKAHTGNRNRRMKGVGETGRRGRRPLHEFSILNS